MKVVLCSIFRNSAEYVDHYFEQARSLRALLESCGDTLSVVVGEGDSTDRTKKLLMKAYVRDQISDLVPVDHGGLDYGRVDDPRRWAQIAFACNRVLDHIPPDADIVVYVESDLFWWAEDISKMIWLHPLMQQSVLTCMVYNQRDASFWDVWAYRRNGVKFKHWPPYHPDLNMHHPLSLDSCGSILVMSAKVARETRFQPEDGIVGWCRDITKYGRSIILLPWLSVSHPSIWSAPRE